MKTESSVRLSFRPLVASSFRGVQLRDRDFGVEQDSCVTARGPALTFCPKWFYVLSGFILMLQLVLSHCSKSAVTCLQSGKLAWHLGSGRVLDWLR